MNVTVEKAANVHGSLTEQLAEFVLAISFEAMPEEVVRRAKNSFLDTLGLALAGMAEPGPRILAEYVKRQGTKPVATILAHDFKANPAQAALVNGTAADVLGWSDVSVVQMNHPSVSVCPVVWALGEQLGTPGRTLVVAHVLGAEVANKIGAIVRPHLQLKGWHPVAVLNTFGAAASAARLLSLDRNQILNALGIAGAEASGIRASTGTMSKAYGAGRSARDGITCAALAEMGFTGPQDVIECRDGFLRTYGPESDGPVALEPLGKPFEFISPGISLKKFPSCTRSHTSIQGALNLMKNYGFEASDVQSVECLVTPAVADFLKYPSPRTASEAKFSMQFCVAAALLDGRVTTSSFSESRISDATVVSLMQRVRMTIWPEYAKDGYSPPYAPYGSVVKIKLRNGEEFSERVDQTPWTSGDAPDWDEVVAKYRANAEPVLKKSAVDESIEMVKNLERLDSMNHLIEKLRLA